MASVSDILAMIEKSRFITIRYRAPYRPARPCFGDVVGTAGGWCGRPATLICTKQQLQWFACPVCAERVNGAFMEPIGEWFQRHFDDVNLPKDG